MTLFHLQPKLKVNGTIYLLEQYIYWNYISTGTVYLLELCIYRNCISTGTVYLLELYIYWNYISTGTVYLLELYIYWKYVSTGTLYLPELHIYWNYISTPATCHYGIDMGNFTFTFVTGVQLFLCQTFKTRNKIYSCCFID